MKQLITLRTDGCRQDNSMNWLGEEPLGAEWCQELAAATGEVTARSVNTQSSAERATGSEQGKCFLFLSACCLQGNGTLDCPLKMGTVGSGDIWLCHQFYLKTIISRTLCLFLAQE